MVGPLASGQTVVALFIQREVASPVLQRNAGTRDGYAGAKGGVVALDEGDHVALRVGGAQIDRAAAGGVTRFRQNRLVGDESAPLGGVLLAEQVLHPGLHVLGIGHIGLCVGKGQLDGLQNLVVGLWAIPLLRHRQPFQDIEGHEHGDAVAVGRDLPHPVALIVRRDGLHPLGVVIPEVLLAEVTPGLPTKGHDLLHQRASVVALTVGGCQLLQSLGILLPAEDVTGAVGRAVLL